MASLPPLAPELHKSEWDKQSGVLAKLAGKMVADGTNLSKLLTLAEKNWKETASSIKDKKPDVKVNCTVFSTCLRDCVAECNKLLKALDKPIIKNTTKASQAHLKSIQAEANKLIAVLQNPDSLS